jgi:hypothetical protein
MKIIIRAAMMALSIASIGTAYAGDGDGPVADTQFSEFPGFIAKAPVQHAPATVQNGQGVQTYVTRSDHGTWLFAPSQNGGDNS